MRCAGKIGLLVLASIGPGKDLAAAEWLLKGALGQQVLYNDNIALSAIQKAPVFGYLLTPSLQASRKTEILDIAVQGRGDIRRYDDTRWDCDNYNLGSKNDYRTNRSVFSLSGGYGVSCSYAQQLTDTGIILPNNQSENYQLAPSWTWQWTARDELTLGASYSKTSFTNTAGGTTLSTGNGPLNYNSNDTYSVNLGGSHQWSRRLSLNEKINFSNIQYTGPNASTQNLFGFQLGANYKVDRLWTVSAGGGPVWVDSQPSSNVDTPGQNSSLSLGRVANINLTYAGLLNKASAGYSNAVNPSSIGQTLQTQSFFANYSYQMTRHLALDISGNYSLSQSVGGNSSNNATSQFDRSYFTASAGIAWELAKNWQLKGSYAYSWQDYQQDKNVNVQNLNAGTSVANVVMLSLGYSWDGIRISR